MISQAMELELREDSELVYRPSQERIARMCAEFRRNWSEREYRKRSGCPRKRWIVSVVSICLESKASLIE